MKFRQTDGVAISAAKSGFSPTSGYRLEVDGRMPSQKRPPRGRRREDPLVEVWDEEVVPMLIAAPALRPVAVLKELMRRRPELDPKVRRTLERRLRAWRAVNGPDQDVIFRQVHDPGRLGLSDFTDMSDLGVTIAGAPLDHRRF